MSTMILENQSAASSGGRRDFIYTTSDFTRVRKMIYTRAGISLSESKQDMVYSRLARRLRALDGERFSEYLDALDADPESPEWESFTNALTTNLTSFYREAHHFDILEMFLARRKSGHSTLWCSAASTGEEPYSMAITAIESFGTSTPPVSILATDIDTQVLQTASRGVYPIERVESIGEARLKKYFKRGRGENEGFVKVNDCLRSLISFRQLNLLDGRWPMKQPFDAIFCRNVMIYFDKPTQRDILSKMKPLMKPDGLLFCGHSESFHQATDLFRGIGKSVYAPVVQGAVRALPGRAQ